MNLPLIDPSLPHLINQSPYTPSTSLSSSHPSPQDLGLFDHTFDGVPPQALGFNHEATALSTHPFQREHVFYYFEHVRKSLFAFTSNSAANAIYSVSFLDRNSDLVKLTNPSKTVSQSPQGTLTNAICALASLHNMRVRAARGLEPVNSTLENSSALIFYDTAHAQLYKSREGALTEVDANAALHLLGFSVFSGGVTDWRPMLDIANDWMIQTGIPAHENPKLGMIGMSQAARIALKATMVRMGSFRPTIADSSSIVVGRHVIDYPTYRAQAPGFLSTPVPGRRRLLVGYFGYRWQRRLGPPDRQPHRMSGRSRARYR